MKFNNLDEKRAFLKTALQKGTKAARIESNPVLLYYEQDGKYYGIDGSEINQEMIASHPAAQQITKDDLDL